MTILSVLRGEPTALSSGVGHGGKKPPRHGSGGRGLLHHHHPHPVQVLLQTQVHTHTEALICWFVGAVMHFEDRSIIKCMCVCV